MDWSNSFGFDNFPAKYFHRSNMLYTQNSHDRIDKPLAANTYRFDQMLPSPSMTNNQNSHPYNWYSISKFQPIHFHFEILLCLMMPGFCVWAPHTLKYKWLASFWLCEMLHQQRTKRKTLYNLKAFETWNFNSKYWKICESNESKEYIFVMKHCQWHWCLEKSVTSGIARPINKSNATSFGSNIFTTLMFKTFKSWTYNSVDIFHTFGDKILTIDVRRWKNLDENKNRNSWWI